MKNMIRFAALAFTAAAIVAAPAFAQTATQVRLDGRTETQIRSDVQTVARRLCAEKIGADAPEAVEACVAEAVRTTMRKISARGGYVFTQSSAD